MEMFVAKLSSVLGLFGIDLLFLAPLLFGLAMAASWRRSAFAVFKRDFLAYFTNPIGYVFLCLFVALSSITAFWSEAFFSSNLANLDQLNRYIPLILLVFIPAITMSIWAEERRLGTDELLLTMPATDFDIVLGKYLGAVAIYTISLLFSQICNYLVLISLGSPDLGLFLGNYFGYWVVGLAMLAIGMVASFMTRNLTVGFILGIVFCAPLVIASWADIVFPEVLARKIVQFSISAKFYDFQSGVISSSSLIYFLMIITVMLYLSMVLIGRRHWAGIRDQSSMTGHYVIRALALILIAGSVSVAAAAMQLFRLDVTSERLGSLSPRSLQLIQELSAKEDPYVLKIEAFISQDLPEEFVQKRFNFLSTLREIKAVGGKRVKLRVYDGIDIFGEQANRAETLYGIKKETMLTTVRGAATSQDVIFGVAFEYGLERVVVPFMGESLPVEYELMRSLATVLQQKQMIIGVLNTEARLMIQGGFPGSGSGEQPLIQELKKQYKVVEVDPSQPISEQFDVLLAVQPSSLNEAQMQNFIAAVRAGQATAIYEDPFPVTSSAPGTDQPRQPQGQMAFMRQPPEPKGNLAPLWNLLGIKLVSIAPQSDGLGLSQTGETAAIVWQDYTPHPEDGELQNEYVWITPACHESGEPLNAEQPISSGLQKLLFLYPGAIEDIGTDVGRAFIPLVSLGRRTGVVRYRDCITRNLFGQADLRPREEIKPFEKTTGIEYVLAAAIHVDEEKFAESKETGNEGDRSSQLSGSPAMNVVVVADMDVLAGVFFLLRERASFFGERFAKWQVDNVPFVLNVLDDLAGDSRFIDIRKRRPMHRELMSIKRLGDKAKEDRDHARQAAQKKFKTILTEEQSTFDKIYESLSARTDISRQQQEEELAMARRNGSERIESRKAQLDREEKAEYRQIENEMAANIHRVQDNYKVLAVLLPPILPLMIAVCVFFVRRSRERESIHASRLR